MQKAAALYKLPETDFVQLAVYLCARDLVAQCGGQDLKTKTTSKTYTFWLTGLSGAGKTTLAQALAQHLHALGQAVCVLDGDELRAGLCRDLSFSAADREENMRRTAEMARLLNGQGITVIVALISPTASGRAAARQTIGWQQFIEIYVNTPLAICQERDVKGLYTKASQDNSFALTGIAAPYEAPLNADLCIDTSQLSLQSAVAQIFSCQRP
jgi:adenylylsulfate kinase